MAEPAATMFRCFILYQAVENKKNIATVHMRATLLVCHFLLYGIRLLICSQLYRKLCSLSPPLWQSPYCVRIFSSFVS